MKNHHSPLIPTRKVKVIGIGGYSSSYLTQLEARSSSDLDVVQFCADWPEHQKSLVKTSFFINMPIVKSGSTAWTERPLIRMSPAAQVILNDTCENATMLFVLFDPSVPQDMGLAMACAEVAREKNTLVMAIIEISKNNESPISYYPKRPRLLNVFNSILFVQKDYPSESSEVNQVDFSTVHNAITGISDTILIPGCIGVDFADVKSVVDTNTQGYHFTAHSKGSARGLKAARKTVKKMHQMNRVNLEPTSALITVSTSECLGIKDVHEVVSYLQENLPEDIDMIFSIIIDESAGEFLRISLYLWNYVT